VQGTNDDEGGSFSRDEGKEAVCAEQDVGVAMVNFGEVNAQNRDQQDVWTTSDNDTTIRCCEASNDVALRSGRATMVRLCSTAAAKRRNGSRGRGRGSARASRREAAGRRNGTAQMLGIN
jgi:hypothetical protein